jgi:hypothetical protein
MRQVTVNKTARRTPSLRPGAFGIRYFATMYSCAAVEELLTPTGSIGLLLLWTRGKVTASTRLDRRARDAECFVHMNHQRRVGILHAGRTGKHYLWRPMRLLCLSKKVRFTEAECYSDRSCSHARWHHSDCIPTPRTLFYHVGSQHSCFQ